MLFRSNGFRSNLPPIYLASSGHSRYGSRPRRHIDCGARCGSSDAIRAAFPEFASDCRLDGTPLHSHTRFAAIHFRSEERRVGNECRSLCDWSSDVCSSDLTGFAATYPQFIWQARATPATEAVRGGILIVAPDVVPATRYARLFLNSLQIAGWMARLYILILVLRPFISDRKSVV